MQTRSGIRPPWRRQGSQNRFRGPGCGAGIKFINGVSSIENRLGMSLEKKVEDLELGLEALIDKYGLDKIMKTVARLATPEAE